MPTSTRKDRCIGFSIHRAPANVSRKDFEAKAAVLVESLVALPVAQRNCVKFDLILQNDALDGFLEAQGLLDAKQKTSVWITLTLPRNQRSKSWLWRTTSWPPASMYRVAFSQLTRSSQK
ncbi:hypothetical protein B0H11DRAFT_1911990 [Mycena galericulata]|nr:hypothetical protein B0H11DRAFT_1911990 [Mycena galericulata]